MLRNFVLPKGLRGFVWGDLGKRNKEKETECFGHISIIPCIQCKNKYRRGYFLKSYIEERAIEIARYIIDNNATVRQTAKQFGISKSTVHMV